MILLNEQLHGDISIVSILFPELPLSNTLKIYREAWIRGIWVKYLSFWQE